MEITDVDAAHLGGNSAVVRIQTDEGVTGYGEGVVEALPRATVAVVDRLGSEYLEGRDPSPLEKHRRRMEDAVWYKRGTVVTAALTGIEHALWDLKGKSLGVPVHSLLGGPVRDRIRVYEWIGENVDRSSLAEEAEERVAQGFDAMKFSPTPSHPSSYPQVVEECRETVREVREAVGPDVDLMLDPAKRFKLAEARDVIEAVAEFDPLFAEDFIPTDHIPAVEKLADAVSVPVALGDDLARLREFEPVIQRDAAAVLQPDVCHSGGILEITRIAAAAEHHGIRIAPHNPQGPIATAAAIHADLAVTNFLVQEFQGTDPGPAEEYVDVPWLEVEDGRVDAPESPGLGVEVDDAVFEEELDVPDAPLYVDTEDFHVPEW
jgi:galactonate dehydratase